PDLPQVFTKVADAMDKQNQLKNAMKQAEFLALQNQINPHFLYNTLEAIRGDALQAGLSTIVDVTEALAMYFRYTISRVDRLVTLSDELRNAASYFAIQKYRYGERVNMDIRYAPEDAYLLGARIPKLTLQPLIENAITHGLEPKISAGHIVIQFECTQSRLLIEVSDDGVGVSPETLTELRARLLRQVSDYEGEAGPEGGIALVNVNSRLRLLFGEQFGVSLDSTQGFGTDVSITLPLTFDEREDGRP
ncbi:MAG: histidine kinase, partial [Clostridia bacterium]|nr:histidine kinase [Clostridia bacterium]